MTAWPQHGHSASTGASSDALIRSPCSNIASFMSSMVASGSQGILPCRLAAVKRSNGQFPDHASLFSPRGGTEDAVSGVLAGTISFADNGLKLAG